MLCSHYGMLDWCGLVDLRRAPIATGFCVGGKFRNVPQAEVVAIGRRQKNKCNASNDRAGRFVYRPSAVRRTTTYIAMVSCR